MKKRQYIAPALTAVEFKTERGYAISLIRLTNDQETASTFNSSGQENWDDNNNSLFGSW